MIGKYAAIKLDNSDVQKVIEVENIYHFDPELRMTRKFWVKFPDGKKIQAMVGMMDDDKEKLEKLIENRRPRYPPSSKIDSPSDLTDLTDPDEVEKNGAMNTESVPEAKVTNAVQKELLARKNRINARKESNQVDGNQKATPIITSITTISPSQQLKEATMATNVCSPLQSDVTPESPGFAKLPLSVQRQSFQNDEFGDVDNCRGRGKENFFSNNSEQKRKSTSEGKMSAVKLQKMEKELDDSKRKLQTALQRITEQEQQMSNDRETIAELRNENRRQKHEIDQLKQLQENNEIMLAEASKASIDIYKEFSVQMQQLHEAMRALRQEVRLNASTSASSPYSQIGDSRDDGSMKHVGRNCWIPVSEFEELENLPIGKAIRELARKLFSAEELLAGTPSGRSVSRKNKDQNDAEKQTIKKLDPRKLGAISDFVSYLLTLDRNKYLKKEKRKMYEGTVDARVGQMCNEMRGKLEPKAAKRPRLNGDTGSDEDSNTGEEGISDDHSEEQDINFSEVESSSSSDILNFPDLNSGKIADATPLPSENEDD